MPRQVANPKLEEASISAKIVRADGSVEDLGRVAYFSRNPFKRLAFWAGQKLRGGSAWLY